jgi:pyrimidine operon attenuation protein/uracil phosphoribosyltransferase
MNGLPLGHRTCIYDPEQVVEIIDRMSCKAAALLHDSKKLAIIGVLRRGAPLADKLTELLVQRYRLDVPLRLDLLVKRCGEDLTLIHAETNLQADVTLDSIDLRGYTLLLVDDVLYTGHSLMRVITYLMKKNPARIMVACLVDRKVNVMPIKAEIVGVDLQIAEGDIVECHIPPYENTFEIQLLKPTPRGEEGLV